MFQLTIILLLVVAITLNLMKRTILILSLKSQTWSMKVKMNIGIKKIEMLVFSSVTFRRVCMKYLESFWAHTRIIIIG